MERGETSCGVGVQRVDDVIRHDVRGVASSAAPPHEHAWRLRTFAMLPASVTAELERRPTIHRSHSGLFPAISRAWASVDSTLFLWNYIDGSDMLDFRGSTEVILTCILAPARPEVFDTSVTHVLLLACPSSIRVFAVTVTTDGPLILTHTPFAIPSDNTVPLSATSTKDGRVFLACDDGTLRELTYGEQRTGWLSSLLLPALPAARWRVVLRSASMWRRLFGGRDENGLTGCVADSERGMVHVVSPRDGLLLTYSTRSNSTSWTHIGSASEHGVVCVGVMPQTSEWAHVVVVLSNGARVYFRCVSGQTECVGQTSPPHRSEGEVFHAGFVCPETGDVVLAGVASGDEKDSVTWIPADNPRKKAQSGVHVLVDGRTVSFALIPSSALLHSPPDESEERYMNGPVRGGRMSVLSEPRGYVCLTGMGLHLLMRYRPVDVLTQLLGNASDKNAVRQYLSSLPEEEACALCAFVSVDHPWDMSFVDIPDTATKQMAVQLFSEYDVMRAGRSFEQGSTAPLRGVAVSSGCPSWMSTFSSGHNGTYLLAARMLAPIWEYPLWDLNGFRASASPSRRVILVGMMQKLASFADEHEYIPVLASDTHSLAHAEEVRSIRESVDALITILRRTSELLTFSLLVEDGVSNACVMSALPLVKQQQQPTVKQLVGDVESTRRVLLEFLQRLLVAMEESEEGYRANGVMENVVGSLETKCPSFFTGIDVRRMRAYELLAEAQSISPAEPRRHRLAEKALEILRRHSPSTLGETENACQRFHELGYCLGVLDISLRAAHREDPSGLAGDCFLHGVENRSVVEREAYNVRSALYDLAIRAVLPVLELVSVGDNVVGSSGIVEDDERDPLEESQNRGFGVGIAVHDGMGTAMYHEARSEVVRTLSAVRDDMFLFYLFDTLLDKNLVSVLLQEMRSEVVREYLIKRQLLDLLHDYFVVRGRHKDAAILLSQLAIADSDTPLERRIEYLQEAIVQASTAGGNEELLREVEERLEVAVLQLDVRNGLRQEMRRMKDEFKGAAAECDDMLSANLQSLNDMYQNCALKFHLWWSALRILAAVKDESHKTSFKEIVDCILSGVEEENVMYTIRDLVEEFYGRVPDVFPLDYIISIAQEYWDVERVVEDLWKVSGHSMEPLWKSYFVWYRRSQNQSNALNVLIQFLHLWKRESMHDKKEKEKMKHSLVRSSCLDEIHVEVDSMRRDESSVEVKRMHNELRSLKEWLENE